VVVPRRDTPAEARFSSEGVEDRCDVVQLDLTDYGEVLRVLHEYRVKAIFHLAAQSITAVAARSPYSTWESNLRGTYTLLEAARAAREVGEEIERLVVASSVLAYGNSANEPWREDHPLEPVGPYAVSKAATDLIARSYARDFELPVAVTRMAHVYGGGDLNFSRLVPDSCRALVSDERPTLRSDGTPLREFLYVDDAVSAYLTVAAAASDPAHRGRAWNAGPGQAVPVLDVVERLVAVSGRNTEPDIRGEPAAAGAEDRQQLDSSAIRDQLGWRPEWDLDRGLAATYAWYAERLAA
jgi:CDP-glucose 4,6-dehydratase